MNIAPHIDFTLLKPKTTQKELHDFLMLAIQHGCRGICTFDEYFDELCGFMNLSQYFNEERDFRVSVVRGFPFGIQDYNDKLKNPHPYVNEIDIVPNLNHLYTSNIYKEFKAIREFYKDLTVKVIIETEMLNEDEINHLCSLCNLYEMDFIKTCTGKNGKLSDEKLDMVLKYRGKCKVKASGGIKTREKAVELINKGVDVIGTSTIF